MVVDGGNKQTDTSDCRVALAAEKGSFSIYLEQMWFGLKNLSGHCSFKVFIEFMTPRGSRAK